MEGGGGGDPPPWTERHQKSLDWIELISLIFDFNAQSYQHCLTKPHPNLASAEHCSARFSVPFCILLQLRHNDEEMTKQHLALSIPGMIKYILGIRHHQLILLLYHKNSISQHML